MSDYTPTMAEIREYVETGGEPRPWVELDEVEESREKARAAAFDRALAEHDREVAARTLEDAANAWTQGEWANTPRKAERAADRLSAAQYAGDWLRKRALGIRTEGGSHE